MKYYVFAIEQTLIEGTYNEYAPAVQKFNDLNAALTYFFTRLGELANSAAHTYAELKIINSGGTVVKRDSIGAYVINEV